MIQEPPTSLDPLYSESVYDSLPINQLFDTLVAVDSAMNVVPSLAHSWKISRDGLDYRFELRDDVRFHDGKMMTADDVIFTFERVLRFGGQDSIAYPYLTVIDGAEELAAGKADSLRGLHKVDESTVVFQLTHRNPLFLELLTMDNVAIVPRHILQDGDAEKFGRAPIGTGPFAFGDWSDEHLRLDRNRDYFRKPSYLDEVRIYFYGDDEGDYGASRFLAGELDLMEPTSRSIDQIAARDDIDVQRYQELSLSFLGLNASRPPLDQPWLRQAIAHAINRDAMVQDSPELRLEAPGILPPGIAGFSPELKRLDYNPQKSRELLAANGHPEGKGLSPIRLYDPTHTDKPDPVLQRILDDVSAVGIQLQLVPISWQELGERLDDGSCEAFVLAWVADMSDPDAFLSTFGEYGTGNLFHYNDTTVREMLRKAEMEFDPNMRGRLYRDVERYVLQQAPIVPLYHTRGALAAHQHVAGVKPSPYGIGRLELEQAWIRREGDIQ